MTTCTTCLGDGYFIEYGYSARNDQPERKVTCETCNGDGEIEEDEAVVYSTPVLVQS